MLRSLYSGISGLQADQTMLDVVGNNIANVNTPVFKASQTVFEDTLSQLLKAAGAPSGTQGGTNPAQVGLGVQVAGVTTNFSQGASQSTGRATDMMISGDGFFVVRSGAQQLYTRAGAFTFDAAGQLTTPTGSVVQGWMAKNGVINANGALQDIQLPVGATLPPQATTTTTLGGNLSALPASTTWPLPTGTTAPTATTSITMYDQQGAPHAVSFTFTQTGANQWAMQPSENGTAIGSASTLTFGANGQLTAPTAPVTITPAWATTGITVDMGAGATGITQYGGASTVSAQSADGSAAGSLQSFTVSPDGAVVGVFSNGLKQPLAQVALASFTNPEGLTKTGNSSYTTSANSGTPQIGVAGTGTLGQLNSGMLEMSNVDLAQEFTNLIVAERAFQANAKIITTSDSVLQDLVNLKQTP
ncbi:MAG: flagellar hook protein FlgE [Actinomycetes bacterium]